MFLVGRIATNDATAIPNDMMIERVCNDKVRQQVYAAPGGSFSMQLGSRTDTVPDASGDPGSPFGVARKDPTMGIPRRDLTNCDLRASASGFRPGVVSLMQVTAFDGIMDRIDVGTIVVQRAGKIEGMTLSATPYKAPKDARKAYEKGLEAEKNGKLVDARKHYETAVQLYPAYESAWFRLGTIFQKQNDNDAARNAFTRATTINTKYMPPYLSLASMAFDAQDWPDVLKFTGHILDLDPLNHATVTGYVVDLDPWNFAEAYFYNAAANYNLGKFEDAEKSALKAEHVDLRTHFAQLHLLLAKIYVRKNDYANAIFQLKTYLELVPFANDADQLREQLAQLERLNDLASTSKPEQD
jgi:thioredoxin-like negative regulator of GroEL